MRVQVESLLKANEYGYVVKEGAEEICNQRSPLAEVCESRSRSPKGEGRVYPHVCARHDCSAA